jgi:hypothetical protein
VRFCGDSTFGNQQTARQRQLQVYFTSGTGGTLWQRMQETETSLQMRNRFEVSRLRRGMPSRLQPVMGGALRAASGCQMMGEQFRLPLDQVGKMGLQCGSDAPM